MKLFKIGSVLTVLAIFSLFSLNAAYVAEAAGPASVNLGSAGNFTILAKTGISTTGSTSITGDIGVSPIAASAITGFSLSLTAQSPYATTPMVSGKVYASDYANPTPSTLSTAISDMQTAYTDAAGRTNPTATELGAGNLGGLTIAPGLYKFGTGVTIPTNVTLSGSSNDVWIFQIAQTLNVSSGVKIVLSGGAQASNIFWQVAGQTTIGTTAEVSGNILGQTAIVFNTGAKLTGRALAQTAVTLDSNAVTGLSAGVSVSPSPSVSPTTSPTVSPSPVITPTQPQNTPSANNNNNGGVPAASTPALDTGCAVGNKFSVTTGRPCAAYTNNASANAAFGQQVRMIAISMSKGSRNNDVATLQNFLISQNKGSSARALADVGATAYFGGLTKAALAEFQAHAGIYPSLGNFGPLTRVYLSRNY